VRWLRRELAVEYGLIARNPATGRRRRLPTSRPNRPWLDRTEHIRALLNAATRLDEQARHRPGQRRTLIATLIFAGLRIGEALSLRWRDIDVDAGTIAVNEAKTPAGVRTINLLPVLRSELAVYTANLDDPPDAFVFQASSRRPLERNNARQRILAPAIQLANGALAHEGLALLPAGLTFHSLRRTFASLLYALGEPPPYVMNQIGHTTPALTLALYAKHMSRRDGEQARLTALVEGTPTTDQQPRLATSTATTTGRTTATLRTHDTTARVSGTVRRNERTKPGKYGYHRSPSRPPQSYL
jgi:integrase